MGNSVGGNKDLIVSVQTGDRKGAGSNANIWIQAKDEEDNASEEIKLNQFFEDNFQRGKNDVFEISRKKFSELKTPVDKIELWRDYAGLTSSWFVDTITVEDPDYNVMYTFPIHRWIRPNYRYIISQYDTSLPADDVNPEQRVMELEESKKIYRLSDVNPRLPVQVAQVPDDENLAEDDNKENKMANVIETSAKQLRSDVWTSLSDINNIYTSDVLYTPKCQEYWMDDEFFGYQRLNGVNPNLIRLCTDIPKSMVVTDAMLKPFLEGQSVKAAIKAKKLYMCDLEIFRGYFCPGESTTICSPVALFYLTKDGRLMPVAIQHFQITSESNPIFLPSDDKYTWLLAKIWYNNAEANYHLAVTYLGITCLLMESVAVSFHRHLSISHPVHKLLVPYFKNLMLHNSEVVSNVLCEDGVIDRVVAIGASGVKKTIKKQVEECHMDSNSCLPDDLVRRGVSDSRSLPGYYYRDDGILLYYAIQNYVIKYIALYYDGPDSLENDHELQHWVKEMAACREDGGMNIKGLPSDGCLCKLEQLHDLLTSVIFTCTVQRSAVGSTQYDNYGFPAAYPLKLFGKPPTDKNPRREIDVLDTLQNATNWSDTVALSHAFTTPINPGVLGSADQAFLYDPRAVAVHSRFVDELEEIGKVIREKNISREHSYHYLLPSAM